MEVLTCQKLEETSRLFVIFFKNISVSFVHHFLEARASLKPCLSVTESVARSHFSSSTSQIKLIIIVMVGSGKVTLRILRIILRVDWMGIGLVRRCVRMVRTIIRIIQMVAKNVRIDIRMIKIVIRIVKLVVQKSPPPPWIRLNYFEPGLLEIIFSQEFQLPLPTKKTKNKLGLSWTKISSCWDWT